MKLAFNLSMMAMVVSTLTWASAALAQQPSASPTGTTPAPAASPVPAPFDDGSHGRLKPIGRAHLLLSGYHGLPSKPVFVRALDHPRSMLLSVATAPHESLLMRKRALSALGYFADDAVRRVYLDKLKADDTRAAIRHRVMLLLADHFPQTALPYLKPYLSHAKLQYRLTAIAAIRRLPSPAATEALTAAMKTETNPLAQKRLRRYSRHTR